MFDELWQTDHSALHSAFVAILLVLSILGATGNTLLSCVLFFSRCPKNYVDCFVMFMTFADVLMCLAVFPFALLSEMKRGWADDRILCALWVMLDSIACLIMTYSLLAIYLPVCSDHCKRMCLASFVWTFIAFAWAVGLLSTLVPFVLTLLDNGTLLEKQQAKKSEEDALEDQCMFRGHASTATPTFLLLLPLVSCTCAFFRLLCVSKSPSNVQPFSSHVAWDPIKPTKPPERCFRDGMDMKNFMLVFGVKLSVILISRLPFVIARILHYFCGRNCVTFFMESLVMWLTYVSSWLNPFVFFVLHKRTKNRALMCAATCLRSMCGEGSSSRSEDVDTSASTSAGVVSSSSTVHKDLYDSSGHRLVGEKGEGSGTWDTESKSRDHEDTHSYSTSSGYPTPFLTGDTSRASTSQQFSLNTSEDETASPLPEEPSPSVAETVQLNAGIASTAGGDAVVHGTLVSEVVQTEFQNEARQQSSELFVPIQRLVVEINSLAGSEKTKSGSRHLHNSHQADILHKAVSVGDVVAQTQRDDGSQITRKNIEAASGLNIISNSTPSLLATRSTDSEIVLPSIHIANVRVCEIISELDITTSDTDHSDEQVNTTLKKAKQQSLAHNVDSLRRLAVGRAVSPPTDSRPKQPLVDTASYPARPSYFKPKFVKKSSSPSPRPPSPSEKFVETSSSPSPPSRARQFAQTLSKTVTSACKRSWKAGETELVQIRSAKGLVNLGSGQEHQEQSIGRRTANRLLTLETDSETESSLGEDRGSYKHSQLTRKPSNALKRAEIEKPMVKRLGSSNDTGHQNFHDKHTTPVSRRPRPQSLEESGYQGVPGFPMAAHTSHELRASRRLAGGKFQPSCPLQTSPAKAVAVSSMSKKQQLVPSPVDRRTWALSVSDNEDSDMKCFWGGQTMRPMLQRERSQDKRTSSDKEYEDSDSAIGSAFVSQPVGVLTRVFYKQPSGAARKKILRKKTA